MPRLRLILSLVLSLLPAAALGRQSIAQDKPGTDDAKSCVSTNTADEVLRLGRSLGYADQQILEAYGRNPCAALSYFRAQAANKAQPNGAPSANSSATSSGTGYVKCSSGASKVSVWLAPGVLTVVASPRCAEALNVLEDGQLWMKVRTEAGTVGFIPRAAVEDSPNGGTGTSPVVSTAESVSPVESPSISSQSGPSCDKVVSFAQADPTGVHPFMGTGNWIQKWTGKNAKKYRDVCFSQTPMSGRKNYLIVLSQSAGYLTGFDPVVRTNTSTSTSPVSGSGTVTDNYGGMWYYTFNGTVTTSTTTTTSEDVPYTIDSRTLYANGYNERGVLVSQHWHVYSTKSGGDAANSFGYNMGNALAAISARGRLLGSVVKDIEGKK